ncbi:ankyrin repeat-containing domain protein [Aspergillus egyptiacus]|nr:ankyrin repeat-containing domain protein [Aspergillus egyptiacus]
MSLPSLPTELLILIAEEIPSLCTLSSLSRTSHRLNAICRPLLYKLDAQSTPSKAITWAARHGDMDLLERSLRYTTTSTTKNNNHKKNKCSLPTTSLPHKVTKWGELRMMHGKTTSLRFDTDLPPHPLCLAVQHNHIHIADALIAQGCSPNIYDQEGYTLLCLAVIQGHVPMVRALLSRGATTDSGPVSHPNSALQIAAFRGDREIVEILLLSQDAAAEELPAQMQTQMQKQKQRQDAVECALLQGHLHLLPVLLGCGSGRRRVDLDFRFSTVWNADPCSPLLWAVEAGDVAVAKMLLNAGANADFVPRGGREHALLRAVGRRDEEMVRVLVPGSGRRHWMEALALARGGDYAEADGRIIRVLMENGPASDDGDVV